MILQAKCGYPIMEDFSLFPEITFSQLEIASIIHLISTPRML